MLMRDRELEYGPPHQRRAQTADKPVDIFGGFFVLGFALSSGLRRLVCVVAARMTFAQAGLGVRGPDQDHGDLLDVLRCGCRQALACDAGLTSEAGTAMTVKLLGVGKRALDRLLAAFVDRLAPGRQAVGIGALAGIGPDIRVAFDVQAANLTHHSITNEIGKLSKHRMWAGNLKPLTRATQRGASFGGDRGREMLQGPRLSVLTRESWGPGRSCTH